jgi:antitoxin VapB
MAQIGKIFKTGGSQAVRLPKDHRFPSGRVRITKVPEGTLLEGVINDPEAWFQAMDEAGASVPFMEDGRVQPASQRRPAGDELEGTS